MAFFANPTHRSASFENLDLSHDDSARTILDMETNSDDSSQDRINIFVIFVFILDLLVLIFVAVLEFFLRYTRVFPVRHLNFSCNDATISQSSMPTTYADFSYYGQVSDEVVYSLSFCIPIFVLIVGELALWAFTEEDQKNIRVLCHDCKMPQVVRRIFRYTGAFLFGLLVTMIFVDVLKIMTGRLRPTFLDICDPREEECIRSNMLDEDVCRNYEPDSENLTIRHARLSFPSMQSAMTAFAAAYIAIYLHNTIRAHSVRVMRPFICLAFVMMSVLCGVSRYGLHHNHVEDVVVGFLIGVVFAIYIGVFVLNNFREYLSSKKLYLRLRDFFAEQRAMELREIYKEDIQDNSKKCGNKKKRGKRYDRLERQSYFGIPAYQNTALDTNLYHPTSIPRPQQRSITPHLDGHPHVHINESSTDPADYRDFRDYRDARNKSLRPQDTFQRDLQRTLDQYRHGPEPHDYKGHI